MLNDSPFYLSLVTLGVADLPRAKRFYEALGLTASGAGNEHVVFFKAGRPVLSLYGREALAEDAQQAAEGEGFRAVALACNAPSPAAVDALLARAAAAGGVVVKPGQAVFWGGYSGYFTDPDSHLWEVAHNPFFPLDETGEVTLPD